MAAGHAWPLLGAALDKSEAAPAVAAAKQRPIKKFHICIYIHIYVYIICIYINMYIRTFI